MATYSPSTPVNKLGRGGDIPVPPNGGGGGDDSQDSNLPNYGARLRRARLGLICGIATVSMIFISLTSAYVVRQGLPTFDGATNSYVRDWGQVQLPWLLLAINTALLLISSLTMEFARRDIKQRAALAPLQSIPGISLGEEKTFPWLGVTVLFGLGFLVGQWMAWGELKARGFFVRHESEQFVCLFPDGDACGASGGRNYCIAVGGDDFPAAPSGRGTADCGRRYGVVLAFYGGAVGLCFCVVRVGAVKRQRRRFRRVA